MAAPSESIAPAASPTKDVVSVEPAGGTPPSERYVWYVIILLAVANVFNYMDRLALAVLLPLIKADLQLSDGQLGLLIGFAFSVFYAICGVPIARWADRGSRRNIIAISLATWSVMTALSGSAQNFWHLFVTRVGVGAGEAGCLPPAQSMICDYVPVHRRPGVFAINSFGLVVGMMLGMAAAGWLGEILGWRWTFAVLGLPGIALAVVVRLTLREPRRGAFDTVQLDRAAVPLGRTLRTLWRSPTYRMLLLYLTINGFVQFGLIQWWPSFYARVHGLDLRSAGAYLGIATGVGFGLGFLIGGLIASKVAHRGLQLPLMVGAVAIAFALPIAIGSLFASSVLGSITLVGMVTLCWGVPNGPVLAAVYSVTPPNMRAMGGALTVVFISVVGYSLGPYCVGLLSDLMTPAHGSSALRYAMLAPIGLISMMVLALYTSANLLPREMNGANSAQVR